MEETHWNSNSKKKKKVIDLNGTGSQMTALEDNLAWHTKYLVMLEYCCGSPVGLGIASHHLSLKSRTKLHNTSVGLHPLCVSTNPWQKHTHLFQLMLLTFVITNFPFFLIVHNSHLISSDLPHRWRTWKPTKPKI